MKGKVIGGFRLEEMIGRGGMGSIWRGVHSETGATVAVKMLHPELVRDKTVQDRFLREAQAQAQLTHPHIAQILSLVEDQGKFYIIMEFLEGETLLERVRRSGHLSPDEALPILRQILDAVSHAHRLGILHRDLKPANIMIQEGDITKVMDFGTAKILGAESLTLEGTAIGSPHYMSPEQLCGDDLDSATDVYSLGVTLYHALTGQMPYEGESLADLIRNLRDDSPTPPSKHQRIDPILEGIVLKAIAKVTPERFQSAEDFRDALDAYRIERSRPAAAEEKPPERPGVPLRIVWISFLISSLFLLYLLVPKTPLLGMTGILFYVAMIALFISWLASSRKPGRCPKCGREMQQEWKRCQFCELGFPTSGLRASLVGTVPEGTPAVWPIPEGRVALGRQPPCEIVLDDDEISSRHAEIHHRNGQMQLIDLGSRNGTHINNSRLEPNHPTPIYNGDHIRLGKTTLTVEAVPPTP